MIRCFWLEPLEPRCLRSLENSHDQAAVGALSDARRLISPSAANALITRGFLPSAIGGWEPVFAGPPPREFQASQIP